MSHVEQYLIPVVLILFVVYRRVKRSIGFQRFSPRRLKVRLGIFSLIGLVFLSIGFLHPILFAADAAGLACGAVLAYFAIRHSLFEERGADLYYRTHIGIETAVVALFIGRMAYRFLFMFSSGQQAVTPGNQPQVQQLGKDPWTMIIFFLLIAYYLGYYTFVLRRGKSNQTGIMNQS